MNLVSLGKKCIKASLKVLNKSSVEVIKFKGFAKNIQIVADLEAEKAIISILKKSGYSFTVISEESETFQIGKNSEIEVYIDPLDGSSYYLFGNKRFCCSALMFVKEGRVLASFVGDLITGDIYYCDEEFAYCNGKKISFSLKSKGERYLVASYAIKGERVKKHLPFLADLADEKILVLNNSGPLEQAMIITGQYDAVLDSLPVRLWDYCGSAIAEKAGAILTKKDGSTFEYKNIKQAAITARNKEIHKMILIASNR